MAKAKKDSKGESKPSIRALFRTMASRDKGVTMAELRKAAADAGVALAKVAIAESDGALRSHVTQGAKALGWKLSEKEGRIWASAPKAKASKSKAAA